MVAPSGRYAENKCFSICINQTARAYFHIRLAEVCSLLVRSAIRVSNTPTRWRLRPAVARTLLWQHAATMTQRWRQSVQARDWPWRVMASAKVCCRRRRIHWVSVDDESCSRCVDCRAKGFRLRRHRSAATTTINSAYITFYTVDDR